MARIRIVKIPKAEKGIDLGAGAMGTNGSRQFSLNSLAMSGKMAEKPIEARQTLGPVPRDEANLEAEKGETAVVNMGGMPAHFKIGGKRHSQGGTPLDLPDNSFIFSDTAKMKIKDPIIQAQFGMAFKKGGYTPADIAKKYDINKYRKTLADPDSEDIDRSTAEMMISNYNLKLAKLGLVQESIKGFPQGIPVIAMPYIMSGQIDPSEFLPDQAEEQQEGATQPDADMGTARYGSQVISTWSTHKYGGPKAQNGFTVPRDNKVHDIAELKRQAAERGIPTSFKDLLKQKVKPTWEDGKRPAEYSLFNAPKKEYIKKGWDGNAEDEEAFAQDPETKTAYDAYRAAMLKRDSDPTKAAMLMATKEALKDVDVPGSVGWLPGKQNKVSDMMNILDEEYLKLSNPEAYQKKYNTEPRWQTKKKLDELNRKKAKDAFNSASVIKNSSKDPLLVLQAEEDLKKLYDLHPDYRKNNPWEMSDHKITDIYYNDKELYNIDELASKYPTLDNVARGLVAKKAGPKPSVDTYFPSDEELVKMSPEELHKWDVIYATTHPTYKAGGSLLKYQFAGETPSQKAARLKGTKSSTTSGTAPGTKGTKPSPRDVAYDVYAPETIKAAEDKGYNISKIDPSVQYTGTSVGAQSEWDPESGFYYKVGAPRPGKAGLQHYMDLHADIIDEYKSPKGDSGPEAWRRDHLEMANKKDKLGRYGRGDKAIEHVVTNVDKRYADVTGKHLIDFSKPDAYVPGVQLFNLPGIKKKKEEVVAKKQTITTPERAADVVRGPIERHPPVDLSTRPYAPWWLQDIVKISGAAADKARLNQYLPYQQIPEVRLPEATLYDPTRELAANAEQANIQTQGMGAFAGPQALSARSSSIQGQALKNAADIEARYNNMNVGIANQLNQERTSIMNQAAQNRAGLNTQLWDKYTIANQQFDNSKAMARQNIRQSYIDGLTNRGKTQALNTLYPNFYTDPMTGFVNKTGYAAIDPTQASASEFKKIQTIMDTFPGTSFKDASAYVKGSKTADEESNQGIIGYPG